MTLHLSTRFLRLLRYIAGAASLMLLLLPARNARSQPVKRYTFTPGSKLTYHYRYFEGYDHMTNNGDRHLGVLYQADPEFNVIDVDMEGNATIDLVIRNRSIDIPNSRNSGIFYYNNLIPASRIVISPEGMLLYGKIYRDDTVRSLTRELIPSLPEAQLLPDKDVLGHMLRRIWYRWDKLPDDVREKPYVREYDSMMTQPYEYSVKLKTRVQPIVSVWTPNTPNKGTCVYNLSDSVVDEASFTHLHYVNDSKTGKDRPSEAHFNVDLLFRKQDGILASWTFTREGHTANSSNESTGSITLTKVEGLP